MSQKFFFNRRQFTSQLSFESTLARINFCRTEMMMGETKRKINALLKFNNKQSSIIVRKPPLNSLSNLWRIDKIYFFPLASRTESELRSTNVQGENGHKNIL